jgi:hypothetical protein
LVKERPNRAVKRRTGSQGCPITSWVPVRRLRHDRRNRLCECRFSGLRQY